MYLQYVISRKLWEKKTFFSWCLEHQWKKLQDLDPNPVVRFRIQIKVSRIRNTAAKWCQFKLIRIHNSDFFPIRFKKFYSLFIYNRILRLIPSLVSYVTPIKLLLFSELQFRFYLFFSSYCIVVRRQCFFWKIDIPVLYRTRLPYIFWHTLWCYHLVNLELEYRG